MHRKGSDFDEAVCWQTGLCKLEPWEAVAVKLPSSLYFCFILVLRFVQKGVGRVFAIKLETPKMIPIAS